MIMKRYIYAMAIPRKSALDQLSSYSDVLLRHILECVIYKDDLGCLAHWIGEIASWLNKANKLKCKVSLKGQDYRDSLFGQIGDGFDDAQLALEVYQLSELRKNAYPDFEITDDLVNQTVNVCNQLVEIAIPILTAGNVYPVTDWIYLLKTKVFNTALN